MSLGVHQHQCHRQLATIPDATERISSRVWGAVCLQSAATQRWRLVQSPAEQRSLRLQQVQSQSEKSDLKSQQWWIAAMAISQPAAMQWWSRREAETKVHLSCAPWQWRPEKCLDSETEVPILCSNEDENFSIIFLLFVTWKASKADYAKLRWKKMIVALVPTYAHC